MTEQNETEKLLREYWNFVIKPTLKIPIGSFNFSNSDNEGYPRPPLSYKNYQRSDYYYNGKNTFFHYTPSMHNVLNILNEGYIRMSDISLLDDPQELIFAGKSILTASDKNEFKKMKSRTFCFSMCKKDNFDMWRLYGNNGWGAALVFKFLPDFKKGKNSFVSKIYYNDKKKLKVFDNLVKLHKEFFTSNNLLIKENFWEEPNKILAWISIFLAFHKTSLYKNENEVRFLKFDFNDFTYKKLGCKIGKDFTEVRYYKLPIITKENLEIIATEKLVEELILKAKINSIKSSVDSDHTKETAQTIEKLHQIKNNFKNKLFTINYKEDEKLIQEILGNSEPIILIEKILLGYRYTDDEFRKIENSLTKSLARRTGFKIEIERTPLAEQFHPKR